MKRLRIIFVLRRFYRYWVCPLFDPVSFFSTLKRYVSFIREWRHYRQLEEAEPLHFENSYPMLTDCTASTSVDMHYFYQAVWAMERISRTKGSIHIDVGSDVGFIGMLTTYLPVMFIDIRPAKVKLPHLSALAGSLLNLPLATHSVVSLSCLHVVEHVGLGRYGDPLNPLGTRLASEELSRVLMPGGDLYFSTPVGRPRVCFNAHRVHTPQQILTYFKGLELVEFSVVDDRGYYMTDVQPEQMNTANYACGLFWFKRPS